MRSPNRWLLLIVVLLLPALDAAFADYTVTGKFLYEDRDLSVNGFTGAVYTKPIRYGDVQITAGSTVLARGATNASGDFSITVPGSTQQQIRAVCITSSDQTPNLKLRVAIASSTTAFSTSSWTLQSNAINYAGTPTQAMGQTTARFDSDAGKAFHIWDALIDGAEWVASPGVRGSYPDTLFTVGWNRSVVAFSSYYDPTRKYAFIGSYHAQDDPVIYQRFGQFVVDLYSKLDAPFLGFPLFSDDNLDLRTAWAEGTGLFIGATIRRSKGYSRPDFYLLTNGGGGVGEMGQPERQ